MIRGGGGGASIGEKGAGRQEAANARVYATAANAE
jgi:hypothetical protein